MEFANFNMARIFTVCAVFMGEIRSAVVSRAGANWRLIICRDLRIYTARRIVIGNLLRINDNMNLGRSYE